jgi:drug/metabolite transporter (DMT)-like permease
MIILLLLILCNVILAIIFKAFSEHGVDNLNAIITNYFICVVVASLIVGHFIIPMDVFDVKWFGYSVALSLCFIIGFNLMAYSFQKAGVALTVIVSKMSLILPVVFAVVLYNEKLPVLKTLGILSAIAAIVLVNLPGSSQSDQKIKISREILMLPILVWFLSGLIEIILYYVQIESYVTDDSMTFVATSFGIAGILGSFYSGYRAFNSQIYPTSKDLIGGVILGVPNFLTIYLLLYLLEKGWQGTVLFPINNVSILLLTTLVGVVLYREKVNVMKGIGLALSVIAIVFIGMNA